MDKKARAAKDAEVKAERSEGKAAAKTVKKANPLSKDGDTAEVSNGPATRQKDSLTKASGVDEDVPETTKLARKTGPSPTPEASKAKTSADSKASARKQAAKSNGPEDSEDEDDSEEDEAPPKKPEPPVKTAAKNEATKKIDTSGKFAILHLPALLMSDPEGKLAVLNWVKLAFKLTSEGKLIDGSWIFEVPIDHLKDWSKAVVALDNLVSSPDMPYDSSWEGVIKLPGDNLIEFDMAQNDRGEWRLTVEQIEEINSDVGSIYNERKHTFYPNLD